MEYIKVELSDKQRENLLKLATYLMGELRAKFDMAVFASSEQDDELANPINCGTVGCALGHGPYAGIPKYTAWWEDYSLEFIEGNFASPESEWLFCGLWEDADNTPKGAGKRILTLLRYGIPVNYHQQLHGEAPLSYLNETL